MQGQQTKNYYLVARQQTPATKKILQRIENIQKILTDRQKSRFSISRLPTIKYYENASQLKSILEVKDLIEYYISNCYVNKQQFNVKYESVKELILRKIEGIQQPHVVAILLFKYLLGYVNCHLQFDQNKEMDDEIQEIVTHNYWMKDFDYWQQHQSNDGLCIFLVLKIKQIEELYEYGRKYTMTQQQEQLIMQGVKQVHYGCIFEYVRVLRKQIKAISNQQFQIFIKYQIIGILIKITHHYTTSYNLQPLVIDETTPSLDLFSINQYRSIAVITQLVKLELEKIPNITASQAHFKRYVESGFTFDKKENSLRKKIERAKEQQKMREQFVKPSKIQTATMMADQLIRQKKGVKNEENMKLKILILQNINKQYYVISNVGKQYVVREIKTHEFYLLLIDEADLQINQHESKLLKKPGSIIQVTDTFVIAGRYETIFSKVIGFCKIKDNNDKNRKDYNKVRNQQWLDICRTLLDHQRTELARNMLEIMGTMNIKADTIIGLKAKCEFVSECFSEALDLAGVANKRNKDNIDAKEVWIQTFIYIQDFYTANQVIQQYPLNNQFIARMKGIVEGRTHQQEQSRYNACLFNLKKLRKLTPDFFLNPQFTRAYHHKNQNDFQLTPLSRNICNIFNPLQLINFLNQQELQITLYFEKIKLKVQNPIFFCLEQLRKGSQTPLRYEEMNDIEKIFIVYYLLFSLTFGFDNSWNPVQLLYYAQKTQRQGKPMFQYDLSRYPFLSHGKKQIQIKFLSQYPEYPILATRYFQMCQFIELQARNYESHGFYTEAIKAYLCGENYVIQFALKAIALYKQSHRYPQAFQICEKWINRLESYSKKGKKVFFLNDLRAMKAELISIGGRHKEAQLYCLDILQNKQLTENEYAMFLHRLARCAFAKRDFRQALNVLYKIEGTRFQQEHVQVKLMNILAWMGEDKIFEAQSQIQKYYERYLMRPRTHANISQGTKIILLKITILNNILKNKQLDEHTHEWEEKMARKYIDVFLDMLKISPKNIFQVLKVVKKFIFTPQYESFLHKLTKFLQVDQNLCQITTLITEKRQKQQEIAAINLNKKMRKMALKSMAIQSRMPLTGPQLKRRMPQYFKPGEETLEDLEPIQPFPEYSEEFKEYQFRMQAYQKLFANFYEQHFVCAFALSASLFEIVLIDPNLALHEHHQINFLIEAYKKNMTFNRDKDRWELVVGDNILIGHKYVELGCLVFYFSEIMSIKKANKQAAKRRKEYEQQLQKTIKYYRF